MSVRKNFLETSHNRLSFNEVPWIPEKSDSLQQIDGLNFLFIVSAFEIESRPVQIEQVSFVQSFDVRDDAQI